MRVFLEIFSVRLQDQQNFLPTRFAGLVTLVTSGACGHGQDIVVVGIAQLVCNVFLNTLHSGHLNLQIAKYDNKGSPLLIFLKIGHDGPHNSC